MKINVYVSTDSDKFKTISNELKCSEYYLQDWDIGFFCYD